jgi:hypothetical protein
MPGSSFPLELPVGSLGGCSGLLGDGVEFVSRVFGEDVEARLVMRLPRNRVEWESFLGKRAAPE